MLSVVLLIRCAHFAQSESGFIAVQCFASLIFSVMRINFHSAKFRIHGSELTLNATALKIHRNITAIPAPIWSGCNQQRDVGDSACHANIVPKTLHIPNSMLDAIIIAVAPFCFELCGARG